MRNLLRNRFLSPFLLLACVAAFVCAGCGGADDSSTTASTGVSGATGASGATPLSQDDFVSQANSICEDANGQIAALAPPANDLQSIADFTGDGVAIFKPAVEQLSALVPPADLQDQYSEWLDAVHQALAAQEQVQSAAASGDKDTVEALSQQIQSRNDENNQLATDLGLTECAKDVDPQG